jgi:CRP/FNR family cyclic AMP-dependent transcriptional regulator
MTNSLSDAITDAKLRIDDLLCSPALLKALSAERDRALGLQRLMRLGLSRMVAESLQSRGLTSATRIAALPKARFIEDHIDLFASPEIAAEVHTRVAVRRDGLALYFNSLKASSAPHYRSSRFSTMAGAAATAVGDLPDYDRLFGSQDFLSIHHFEVWELAMAADASFSFLTGNDIEARRVRAGGVIFREGEDADELFVIKSGYVRIQIGNRVVADLTADAIFGEMALIDDEPRSATALAITDVELVPVSEKQFLFLVSQTPYFALKVMRVLAQRLRVTNKTLG